MCSLTVDALARVGGQHVAIGELDPAVRRALEAVPLHQPVPALLGSQDQALGLDLRNLQTVPFRPILPPLLVSRKRALVRSKRRTRSPSASGRS